MLAHHVKYVTDPNYLLAAASVFATAYVASRLTVVDTAWYTCIRPPWSPPNYVFPIAWTIIYVLLAVAFGRALSSKVSSKNGIVGTLFVTNLVLNVLWCYAFFRARRPLPALIALLLLWASIVAIMWFSITAADSATAFLLLPYLLWVTFASVLNVQAVRRASLC